MRFYRMKCISNISFRRGGKNHETADSLSRKYGSKAAAFCQNLGNGACIFVEYIDGKDVGLAAATDSSTDIEELAESFIAFSGFDFSSRETTEVTFRDFYSSLGYACRSDLVDDDDEILKKLGLIILIHRAGESLNFGENIIDVSTEKMLRDNSARYGCRDGLTEELTRVYAAAGRKVLPGHPVQYMFMTDDQDSRRECPRILLSALHQIGRITNRRYSFLDICGSSNFSYTAYDTLYESSIGGAVIVRYIPEDDTGDVLASGRDVFEKVCQTAEKYHTKVLTIFCFPTAETRVVKLFKSEMPGIGFVEIADKNMAGEDAREYLKLKAKESSVRTDRRLYTKLSEARSYTTAELNEIFNKWYDAKLIDSSYPEYKDVLAKAPVPEEKDIRGSAYTQLMELIGLAEAKKVITQALDFYKARKLFKAKGMSAERTSMHMVFTGNPGSAKTTVARLFAQILRESGILPTGQLIEVGRADLVGKYVGWTAPAVKKAFTQAKGGVLFIDEAYSLVDDRDGMYGDEAINTIVQEMENMRDDLIVIFAGYPDKMESFLEKNPGLRSRIAFHVGFSDYNTEELCRIAEFTAEGKNLHLTEEAKKRLAQVFDLAVKTPDFGNGRYVRNVIEKAQLAQASRLVHMDYDSVTAEDIHTITEEDIEMPEKAHEECRRIIGFCA